MLDSKLDRNFPWSAKRSIYPFIPFLIQISVILALSISIFFSEAIEWSIRHYPHDQYVLTIDGLKRENVLTDLCQPALNSKWPLRSISHYCWYEAIPESGDSPTSLALAWATACWQGAERNLNVVKTSWIILDRENNANIRSRDRKHLASYRVISPKPMDQEWVTSTVIDTIARPTQPRRQRSENQVEDRKLPGERYAAYLLENRHL